MFGVAKVLLYFGRPVKAIGLGSMNTAKGGELFGRPTKTSR